MQFLVVHRANLIGIEVIIGVVLFEDWDFLGAFKHLVVELFLLGNLFTWNVVEELEFGLFESKKRFPAVDSKLLDDASLVQVFELVQVSLIHIRRHHLELLY